LFDARCIPIDESWDTQNVQSSFWRFYFNEGDGAALQLPDGLYPLRRHEMYFVPAGVRFNCYNECRMQHFFVHFDLLGLPAVALRELFSAPVQLQPEAHLRERVQSVAHDLRVLAAHHSASETQDNRLDVAQQCRLKALVYEALWIYLNGVRHDLRERLWQLTEAHAPVLPALQHIENNLSQPISNALLAKLCYLSEDYFHPPFSRMRGTKPVAIYPRAARPDGGAATAVFRSQHRRHRPRRRLRQPLLFFARLRATPGRVARSLSQNFPGVTKGATSTRGALCHSARREE
jgi:AraC-like DNA-binding protein